MKDYEILSQSGGVLFERSVRKKLRQGWKLHGSPFVQDRLICQAIVHENIKNRLIRWTYGKNIESYCGHYVISGEAGSRDYELTAHGHVAANGSLAEMFDEAELIEAQE